MANTKISLNPSLTRVSEFSRNFLLQNSILTICVYEAILLDEGLTAYGFYNFWMSAYDFYKPNKENRPFSSTFLLVLLALFEHK